MMINRFPARIQIPVKIRLRHGLIRVLGCPCFTPSEYLGFKYNVVNIAVTLRSRAYADMAHPASIIDIGAARECRHIGISALPLPNSARTRLPLQSAHTAS